MWSCFYFYLPSGVKQQPFGFLTQEVVEATTQCLLAEVCFLIQLIFWLKTYTIFFSGWRGGENLQCWKQKLSEIHVWKRFSNPFNSHTRPFNHDVCLSQENCLWFYSYDKWRKSSNDFRPNSVKIPNWLLSKHYLWQRLQSQGKGSKNKMEISNGIFHEGGWSCVPLTFFFRFFCSKNI